MPYSASYSAIGALSLSGKALSWFYTASGGLATAGAVTFRYSLAAQQTCTWNTGTGGCRWYRVTGKCKGAATTAPQPSTPASTSKVCIQPCQLGAGCSSAFSANIAANSLTDLCNQLSSLRLPGPISQIQVFSVPCFSSDPGNDTTCNTLTDVPFTTSQSNPQANPPNAIQPQVISPNCLSMFLDLDGLVCGVAQTYAFVYVNYDYTGSGNLKTSSGSRNVVKNWSYAASGGLRTSSAATSFSPNFYRYFPSGGLAFHNSISSQFLGVLGVFGVATASVVSESVAFAFEPAPMTLVSTDVITTLCCTGTTTVQLLVKHNLSTIPLLYSFLLRNKITLPQNYALTYSSRLGLWSSTQHYKGISDQDLLEKWKIITEYGCSQQTSVQGSPLESWYFQLRLFRFVGPNVQRGFVRLFIDFNTSDVCRPDGLIDFNFTYDVPTQTADPVPATSVIFTDQMGAFRGKSLSTLRFEVSVPAPEPDAGYIDITNYVVVPPGP